MFCEAKDFWEEEQQRSKVAVWACANGSKRSLMKGSRKSFEESFLGRGGATELSCPCRLREGLLRSPRRRASAYSTTNNQGSRKCFAKQKIFGKKSGIISLNRETVFPLAPKQGIYKMKCGVFANENGFPPFCLQAPSKSTPIITRFFRNCKNFKGASPLILSFHPKRTPSKMPNSAEMRMSQTEERFFLKRKR